MPVLPVAAGGFLPQVQQLQRPRSAPSLAVACSVLLLSACASPERQQQALANAQYAHGQIVYELDAGRTEIRFEVMQGERPVVGYFRAADARLTFPECDLDAPVLEVNVATDSVDIGNPLLESVLRGRQWFESDTYPLARFESREIALQAQAAEVDGSLTLRGLAGPVGLLVTLEGADVAAFPVELGFTASTQFDRTRFGMTMARSLVADEVDMEVKGVFALVARNCS